MAPSRRQPSTVSGSWRIVEGDNESFDTTIAAFPDEEYSPASSLQHSSGLPSQNSAASQDSIRDFSRHQDDPDVIMREPFRPTLPGTRSRGLDLKMPMVDVDGSVRRRTRRTAAGEDQEAALRRQDALQSTPPSRRRAGLRRYDSERKNTSDRAGRGVMAALPGALQGMLLWALDVVALAFRYAQKPLALLLAVYLSFGAIIVAQNMVTQSIHVSLSPLCRIPGASFLHLPFCPAQPPAPDGADHGQRESTVIEFEDLMGVQGKLEQVLEKSADGASLPYEMKRSETAIRDLRTLVRTSDIQSRDELSQELDSYVDVARRSAADLQRFNTHCGSAVDSVISINRWTSRYIDTLAPASDQSSSSPFGGSDGSSLLSRWSSWVFAPFLPTDHRFTERAILDMYVEHTAHVSDRVSSLILEAQALLGLLGRAEGHLSLIHELSSRNSASVASRRDETLWTLWTLVGANRARLHNLSEQLSLLRRVDAQRSDAVRRLSALVLELEAIQTGLEDLRDRVAAPELQYASSPSSSRSSIPLSVHIETIDRGIQRLEEARARISAAESDRVREALRRVGMADEPLIEGR